MLLANRKAIEEPIARLANYLDLPADFDGFVSWILRLRQEINIPNDLAAIGIDDRRLDDLGKMAVEDPSSATNPIQHDAATYTHIVTKALKGDLN